MVDDFYMDTTELKDERHLFWLRKVDIIGKKVLGMDINTLSELVDLDKAYNHLLPPSQVIAEAQKALDE